MLGAKQLGIVRGNRTIAAGVDFCVGGGRALVIHGANGSGKTSLIAALAGLLSLDAGSVHWRDENVRDDPARYRRDLAYLGHHDGVSGELSVRENLRFAARLGACAAVDTARGERVLRDAGLAALVDTPANRLSQGQRRRVALARLVLADKPLWLLDEPTDALDDTAVAWFEQRLAMHLRAGGIAVAATHRRLEIDPARAMHLHLDRSAACCA